MEKKFILTIIALLLSLTFALSVQAADLVDLPAGEASHEKVPAAELQKSPNALSRLLLSGDAADTVTIDEEEGFYSVQTAGGLNLEVTVPFGSVCITQDILQQLNLYSSVFSNINNAYQYYIAKGIHMNIYNMLTCQDIFVSCGEEALAKLVGNCNTLSDTDLQYILSFICTNWYNGAEGKTVTINGQTYFVFDLTESGGYYLYETFAASQDVCIYSFMDPGDTESLTELDDLIHNLVITENV